ncbi:alpha/beta hydrolase [Planctomycetales bacterium ZRK34]|nr:alpha/beta hydrolase [Planctomycetales bacterium ZRK34]
MMRNTWSMVLTLALVMAGSVAWAAKPSPTRMITYKTVGDVELKLHVFEPAGHKAGDKAPAIVFYFGGGWVGGSPSQFYPHCAYLASRGMWAAAAEYRVSSRNKTTPIECVKDGKSAIRYVRAHASELGIDPDKLAAGGGSAGGHVAAATATVTAFNEDSDDTSISAVPNALVLFNPVYDNSDKGYGYDRVKKYWQKISPMHNIEKGMPPAIVFLGREDKLIPVATAEAFKQKMLDVGSRSELYLYDGAPHGFFNLAKFGGKFYRDTVYKMDVFLTSLGYLSGEPAIKP